VGVGIVHFGVGGFHRAHQAMYVDSLMDQGKALDWGICGVGVMPFDLKMRDAMVSQDCLYTLVLKDPQVSGRPRSSGRSSSTSTRLTIPKPPSSRWPTRRRALSLSP
jgi:mannitol 2-dehydrogenase